jgi:hypothetical protein
LPKLRKNNIIKRKHKEKNMMTIAAGFMEAEKGFRRIKGYREISLLTNALYISLEANSANFSARTA